MPSRRQDSARTPRWGWPYSTHDARLAAAGLDVCQHGHHASIDLVLVAGPSFWNTDPMCFSTARSLMNRVFAMVALLRPVAIHLQDLTLALGQPEERTIGCPAAPAAPRRPRGRAPTLRALPR